MKIGGNNISVQGGYDPLAEQEEETIRRPEGAGLHKNPYNPDSLQPGRVIKAEKTVHMGSPDQPVDFSKVEAVEHEAPVPDIEGAVVMSVEELAQRERERLAALAQSSETVNNQSQYKSYDLRIVGILDGTIDLSTLPPKEPIPPDQITLEEITDEEAIPTVDAMRATVEGIEDPNGIRPRQYLPFFTCLENKHEELFVIILSGAHEDEQSLVSDFYQYCKGCPYLWAAWANMNEETQKFIYYAICTLWFAGRRGFNDVLSYPGPIMGIQRDAIVVAHANQARKLLHTDLSRHSGELDSQLEEMVAKEGGSLSSRERYLRAKDEPKIIKDLEGTGVVQFGGWLEDAEGRYGYWTERVPGGWPLYRALQQAPELKIKKNILIYFVEILDQLQRAHEKGFIHRDLKPDNVLYNKNKKLPVIIDWNRSRPAFRPKQFTNPGAIFGTPAYMAPEQANAEYFDRSPFLGVDEKLAMANYDERVMMDIYAVGTMLYEAVNGYLPFIQGNGPEGTLLIKMTYLPQAMDKVKVDDQLEQIILKMMTFKPWERCKTASEAAAALRCYIDQMPNE